MVKFHLQVNENKQNPVFQYPEMPVDAFAPTFEVNVLISMCEEHNVKYLLLYEYGRTFPYFNSTLTTQNVYTELQNSGRFTYETFFGSSPRSIYLLSFA
jgi:hypothetical protein